MFSIFRDRRFILTSLLIIIVVSLFYTYYLFRSPLVYGIDGPYYLIQMNSIAGNGTMYHGDPPLTFYTLALINLFVRNPILTVKLFDIITVVATAILIHYLLVRKLGIAPWISLAYTLTYPLSPNTVRIAGDFVKNLYGLFFAALYLILIEAFREKPASRKLAYLYMVGALTLLTHILAYGLTITYTGLLLLVMLARKKRRETIYTAILLALLAGTGAIAVAVAPFYFNDILKLRYYFETGSSRQGETAGIIGQHPATRYPVVQLAIPVFATILGLTIVAVNTYRGKKNNTMLLLNTLTLSILLNPLLQQQLSTRLILASILPATITIATALGRVEPETQRVGVAAGILALSILLASTVATTWGPTITMGEYRELVYIRDNVIGNKACYNIIPPRTQHYWAQYIFGVEHVGIKPHGNCTTYIILEKNRPLSQPRPGEQIVYDGEHYQVRRIHPMPPQ